MEYYVTKIEKGSTINYTKPTGFLLKCSNCDSTKHTAMTIKNYCEIEIKCFNCGNKNYCEIEIKCFNCGKKET